jgi:hypothetical protein
MFLFSVFMIFSVSTVAFASEQLYDAVNINTANDFSDVKAIIKTVSYNDLSHPNENYTLWERYWIELPFFTKNDVTAITVTFPDSGGEYTFDASHGLANILANGTTSRKDVTGGYYMVLNITLPYIEPQNSSSTTDEKDEVVIWSSPVFVPQISEESPSDSAFASITIPEEPVALAGPNTGSGLGIASGLAFIGGTIGIACMMLKGKKK